LDLLLTIFWFAQGASKNNPLKQFADSLNLQRVVTLDEETLVDENGEEFSSDDEEEAEDSMERLTKEVCSSAHAPHQYFLF
jgi:hypothetical protein